MRFLADVGVSPKTIALLRQLGHEAVHVRDIGMQRATDCNIALRARSDASVVLTFDLDFGELLALGSLSRPSVIIFRLGNQRPESVNKRLQTVIREREDELLGGALISVEDDRYRMRRLPINKD